MEDIIFKRRSIRLFKKQEIPEEILRKILLAGMWAPSPKNRQPWKMIAALGKSKEIMLSLMKEGIDRAERGEGIITGSKEYIANARYTMKCMAAAPVTVFITHPEGRRLREDWSAAEKIHELSDVQSIGAAAENMALIAAELKNWLDAGEMVLAMSFGYPAHHPSPLNRKKEEDVIEIRR